MDTSTNCSHSTSHIQFDYHDLHIACFRVLCHWTYWKGSGRSCYYHLTDRWVYCFGTCNWYDRFCRLNVHLVVMVISAVKLQSHCMLCLLGHPVPRRDPLWVCRLFFFFFFFFFFRRTFGGCLLLREDKNPPRFLLNRVPEQITETNVWNQIYY